MVRVVGVIRRGNEIYGGRVKSFSSIKTRYFLCLKEFSVFLF